MDNNEKFDIELLKIFESIDKIEIKMKEKTGFKKNPFPFRPTAEEMPKIYVAREEEKKQLLYFIYKIAQSQESSGLLLLGELGMGKSHTLKYLRAQMHKISLVKILPIYIVKPRGSFREVYNAFVKEIRKDLFDCLWELIWSELKKEMKKDISNFTKDLYKKDVENKVFTVPEKWTNFIEMTRQDPFFELNKIERVIEKILIEKVADESIKKIFSTIIISNDKNKISLAYNYLSGEKLSSKEILNLGVSTLQINDSDIPTIFNIIIDVLSIKNRAIIIMLDEFEDWAQLTSKNLRTALGDLRTSFEVAQNNVGWIIASLGSVWPVITNAYRAIERRFPNVVKLPPLNKSQIEELLIGYLDLARVEQGGELKNDLTPFTKNAVNEIYNYVITYREGRIDEILRICYESFENLKNDNEEKIDDKLVRKTISEIPLDI